jgi:dipeptidase D
MNGATIGAVEAAWGMGLEPAALWAIFAFICAIPHPSRGEGSLADAIVSRERSRGLEARRDGAGNVIVRAPASPGRDGKPILILQAHLDMVPQAAAGIKHDFARDPILPRIESADPEWLRATGTTLGADNGIGMAAALALAESRDIPHGPLEILLTLCEEDGMDGARGLEPGSLRGEILVNLDSEADREICIGCAGAARVVSSLTLPAEAASGAWYDVRVGGLLGGHSGMDIGLGRGNALRSLASVLRKAGASRLAAFEGGDAANAIPRAARALVAVPEGSRSAWEAALRDAARAEKAALAAADPGFELSFAPAAGADRALAADASAGILDLALSLPNGILAMSSAGHGLPGTSCNLGAVHLSPAGAASLRFEATTMTRSERDEDRDRNVAVIGGLFAKAGGSSRGNAGSPAWTPDLSSPLLAIAKEAYREVHGSDAAVRAIHGGLETGLFRPVFLRWDMISIGPTIRYPHSPDEAVNIPSVERFWRFLKEIAARI